jgi:hypothetical protein
LPHCRYEEDMATSARPSAHSCVERQRSSSKAICANVAGVSCFGDIVLHRMKRCTIGFNVRCFSVMLETRRGRAGTSTAAQLLQRKAVGVEAQHRAWQCGDENARCYQLDSRVNRERPHADVRHLEPMRREGFCDLQVIPTSLAGSGSSARERYRLVRAGVD